MKAVYYNKHGGPDVLTFGDVEEPEVRSGMVKIRVRAVSLNHIDVFLRRGLPGITIPLPHIPGCDAAGEVVALGEDVTHVARGDRVLVNPSISCGKCEFCLRGDASLCLRYQLIGETIGGTTCEYILVPGENAIPIPDHMSFEDAASVPLVFTTAWRMLITRARLRAGEDVLILGASAGVGIACIQIARIAGARVFAAASTKEKLDLCAELGADVLINYGEEDFAKRIRKETGKRGVDVVVDYVGKDTWVKSLRSLCRGGRLVTCGATTGYDPTTDLRHIFFRQLEIIGSTTGSRNELMAPLKMIFAGRMRPVVSEVYDIADTAQAHIAMEERRVLGKIVVRVGEGH